MHQGQHIYLYRDLSVWYFFKSLYLEPLKGMFLPIILLICIFKAHTKSIAQQEPVLHATTQRTRCSYPHQGDESNALSRASTNEY